MFFVVKLKKPHRLRVVLLGVLFFCMAGLIGARLYSLQFDQHDYYEEKARRQHLKRVVIQPERGDILDRSGRALAQSTGRLTIYIQPKYFGAEALGNDNTALVQSLSNELSLEPSRVRSILGSKAGTTALAQRLRPEKARQVISLLDGFEIDGRGYWLHRESIRLYPRHLAAPLIGYCTRDGDGDNAGIAGLELQYDELLKGQKIIGKSWRTNINETVQPWEPDDLLAARGKTLVLTIDATIQEGIEEILARHVLMHEAASGGVVVMDPQTGAIIAMASYPTFDNNNFSTATPASMRARTLTDPLETGSVAKLYAAAMLLEDGLATPETVVDCEGGFAIVDGRRVKDSPGHVLHVATFREVLRWSSNVGTVKVSLAQENPRWYEFYRELGFGQPTGVDLPGEGSGIFRSVKDWDKYTRTSLPQGYEMALTPIQITAAMCAIVNGGNYFEPHIVAEVRDPKANTVEVRQPKLLRRVVRPTTSAILRDLMQDIVDNGTGKKARVPGYAIGGKTGTTRKSNIFTHNEYIASFIGVLPIDAPLLTIYVYVDAPQGKYYAADVAAPLFKEVATLAAVNLGIPPSSPVAPVPVLGAPPRAVLASYSSGRSEPIQAGGMPNFAGMTMLEARRALPAEIRDVRFIGSGFATDQFPPAGDPVTTTTDVVLYFSPIRSQSPVSEMTDLRDGQGARTP